MPQVVKPENQLFLPIKSLNEIEYFRNGFVEFDYEGSDQFKGIETLYGSKTRYAYIGANLVKSESGEQGWEFKIFSDMNDVQPRKLFTAKNFPSQLFFRVLNAFEVKEIKRLLDEKKARFDIDEDEERYLTHSINVNMKRLKVYQHFQDYPTYFQGGASHFIKLPERTKLLAQVEQLLDQEPVHLAALVGMTGSGKTVLAKQYMQATKDKYIFKAYFNARDKAALYADYIKLAEQQAIPYPKDASTEQQMLAIKTWLEDQIDSLYVYDNLMDESLREKYLPSGRNHVLLISKHHAILSASRVINLTDLSMGDAKKLMQEITHNSNTPNLETLINRLGNLPLALVQAATYMEKHSTDCNRYLRLINNPDFHQKVLSYDHFYQDQEHEPVWSAFDEDLKTLQQQRPLAFLLLQQICQLSEAWVPRKSLPALVNTDNWIENANAIHALNGYSLLEHNPDLNQVKVNPLLKMLVIQKYPLINETETKLVFEEVGDVAGNSNTLFAKKPNNIDGEITPLNEDKSIARLS